MSELKAEQWLDYAGEPRPCYPKSEADKVIAELEAQKAQAEDDCAYWKMSEGNAANAMHETEEYAMQLYKELRHNKHKRCLAMARWCNYWANYWEGCEPSDCGMFIAKARFYRRWRKRWLELAKEPTWAKFLQLIHKETK